MRIRIQQLKLMRFDADLDPATQINADISGSGSTTLNKEQD
jgi:hypothetical protein